MLCCRVHSELAQETQKTVELIDNIEKQSAHLYHAEPPIDMPFIPPNTSLAQKAGYLMMRRWVMQSGCIHALCYCASLHFAVSEGWLSHDSKWMRQSGCRHALGYCPS